jgi:hypothetical protein
MQISGGNARYFEICNLISAFCPTEAGKFSQFSKGLNGYIFIFFQSTFSMPSGFIYFPPIFIEKKEEVS